MPKLKHGCGSISPRRRTNKDGTVRRYYQGRVYINGTQKSVYGKTKSECLLKMQALRAKAGITKSASTAQTTTEIPEPRAKTMEQWLDEWLKEFKEGKTRRRYYNDLCRYAEKLKSAFGNLKLKNIDSMTILRYFNTLPKSNSTAKLYGALKDCLQRAEDFGLIKKNPCKVVAKPKYKSGDRRPFELEEQNSILQGLSSRYKSVFFFLCSTGLRIGEFLALTPQSIDIARGYIIVSESKDLETNQNGETKTEASVRKVYFNEELFTHFDVQSLGSYSYNAIKKAFCKTYSSLGIKGVSATHSCRHTFASLLYAAGVPDKVIQKQCGHSDLNTTMKIYTDLLIRGESPIYEYILKLKIVLSKHYQIW